MRDDKISAADVPQTEDWIRQSMLCAEADLPGLVQSFCQAGDSAVAFYTDRFQGADGAHIPALLEPSEAMPDPLGNLLELRVFRRDAELWAHRTSVGVDFSCRIAEDSVLCGKMKERIPGVSSEAVMAQYTFETRHLLDISPEYRPYRDGERDNFGCRKLRSSIGGHYALPLGEAEKYGYALLVNYVAYDEDGIAGVADVRLAGFEPL